MIDRMRHVSVSPSEQIRMKTEKQRSRFIESFYPVDRHDCECQSIIQDWVTRLGQMREIDRNAEIARVDKIDCPRAKKMGWDRYEIHCRNCKALIAYIYASDENLSDWCDLHYVCQHDGRHWVGCMTVNVSPIDGRLGFECTCGVDSRDFTLTNSRIEANNREGRDFGKKDSKFVLRKKNG